MDLSLALGERVAAGRVRVNPRELLLKMSKLQAPPQAAWRTPMKIRSPPVNINSPFTMDSAELFSKRRL